MFIFTAILYAGEDAAQSGEQSGQTAVVEGSDKPADPNSPAEPEAEGKKDKTLNPVCAGVLNGEFIDENGLVDYALLRRRRAEIYPIKRDFEALEVKDYIGWEFEDQVAFWINVHNVCTLDLIVDHYPIQPSRIRMIFYPANSIMQISGARDSFYFNVMGREYSLEEIEDNILELYQDPRVLFALSYASLGSAPLRNEPYLGVKLEKQLDNQVRRFLGRRAGMYIDRSQLHLSPIFEWNIDLFVDTYGIDTVYRSHKPETRAIFNFIEQFKGAGWARILAGDKFKLKYERFDWRLNEK